MKRFMCALFALATMFAVLVPAASAAPIVVPTGVPSGGIAKVQDVQLLVIRKYYAALGSRSATSLCGVLTVFLQNSVLTDPIGLTTCPETLRPTLQKQGRIYWRKISVVRSKYRKITSASYQWRVTFKYRTTNSRYHKKSEVLNISLSGGNWRLSQMPKSYFLNTRQAKNSIIRKVPLDATFELQGEAALFDCTQYGPVQGTYDTDGDMTTYGTNETWSSPMDIRWAGISANDYGICIRLQNNVSSWRTNHASTVIRLQSASGQTRDILVSQINDAFTVAVNIDGTWSPTKAFVKAQDLGDMNNILITNSIWPIGFTPTNFSWSITNLLRTPTKLGVDVFPNTGMASYNAALGELLPDPPEPSYESPRWGSNGVETVN